VITLLGPIGIQRRQERNRELGSGVNAARQASWIQIPMHATNLAFGSI
jgi:hypothetical protein